MQVRNGGHLGAGIGHHAVVESERVLGVDACRAGWVGIALTGQNPRAYVAGTIEELVGEADADGPLAVVAVDMPIGLPDRGHRQADVLARTAIGVLRSSVFMTPTRDAMDAPDHHTASARNRVLTGEGISVQAFSLKPKLHEVQRWVCQTGHRVVEVAVQNTVSPVSGLISHRCS